MTIIESIILGIVQGFTEFLPVSSSGHLVLAKNILGIETPGLLFEVILHAGTLLAILFFFRRKIVTFLKNNYLLIIIGTIPAGIVGYFFSSQIEVIFKSIRFVGVSLIITGFLNLFVDKVKKRDGVIDYKNSLFIGIAQAFAIIPGISRSGSTIFMGSLLGVKKKKVAMFSFILSMPAILGANILELINYSTEAKMYQKEYLLGFIFAFISGFFAIKLVFKFLEEGRFKYFAYYCFIVGFLTLLI